MSSRPAGRHRAPVQSSGASSAVAKTSAVIAVSGGLVASLGAAPAQAASPATDVATGTELGATAQTQAPEGLTTGVVEAVAAAPSFGDIGFTATAKPHAKPKPKPVLRVHREERRVSLTSRSTDRASHRESSTRGSSHSTRTESTSRSSERSAPVSIRAGAPGSSQFGAAVVSIASRYAGIYYVYGGTTPAGFDCSGFTSYVFRQVGISLPRTSSAQRAATTRISRSEAVPGDLVFLPGHVGIYAGNGMMWDSPRTGKAISLRAIYSSSATFGRVG